MSPSYKRLIKVIIIVVVVVAAFCVLSPRDAYALTKGRINSSSGLNMRVRPDADSRKITGIPNNEYIEILGETNENGYRWYNIKYKGNYGYSVGKWIKITSGSMPVKNGTVTNCSAVNMRTKPVNGNIIMTINKNKSVKILGETYGKSTKCWYYISYGNKKGFVHKDYIKSGTTPSVKPDVNPKNNLNYEKELAKFPESYKTLLKKLHAKHPSWIFVANKTNLSWGQVIAKESGTEGYRPSLVHEVHKDSWKSMAKGNYNFTTKKYTYWDGPYVAASDSLIKFYMDPRNSFDDKTVFQFISAKYNASLHKSSGLQKMLNNTFMSGKIKGENRTYNSVLMEAAKKSGVSPYTLASMILQEQGSNGQGACISGSSGYYNYFNIGAYPHSGHDSITNGIAYARRQGWNTRTKSIIGGAVWYGNNFVKKKQHTLYLKKFNVMNGINNVAKGQYMTNIAGADDEGYKLSEAFSGSLKEALVFEIPVYNNMPAKCPPPGPGNNNNYLDYIMVNDKKVAYFDRYKQTYNLKLKNVKNITIKVKKNEAKAIVTGTGTKALRRGNNTFKILVKATSGAPRTYTLNVFLDGAGSFTPGWHSTASGKKYIFNNGTYAKGITKINGYTYYFNSNGIMQTGKININGQPYYFTNTGKAASKGWIDNKYYCTGYGKLATGKYKIGTNTYFFNKSGIKCTGFITIGSNKYYFNNSGIMQKGFIKIGNYKYLFDENGVMQKGFRVANNYRRYFDSNGRMLTGRHTINGTPYYFNEDGIVAGKRWIQNKNGENIHYSLGYGKLATGLVEIGSYTYYFDSDGYMQKGFQIANKYKRYFDEQGRMVKGKKIINGQPYYFNQNGVVASKGWIKNSEGRNMYYSKGYGILATDFYKIDSYTYYFGSDGVKRIGFCIVGNYKYYFNENGVMQTGFRTVNGNRRYFDKNGRMVTGKNIIDGKPYYFDKYGVAAPYGWVRDSSGRKIHYSLGDGKLATGKIKVDGTYYNFDNNGNMI